MAFRCWTFGGREPMVFMLSPHSGRQMYLKERSRRTLEAIWKAVNDKERLGRDIFMSIFNMNAGLKVLWGVDKIPDDELSAHPTLARHARSFIMFLDIAMGALKNDPSDLIALARDVGKRHTCYRKVSFDAEYWLLFKNSVIDQLEPFIVASNACTKEQGRALWNKFLMYLIMEMKDAFYAEMKRRHSADSVQAVQLAQNNLYLQLERRHKQCYSDEDVYERAGGKEKQGQQQAAMNRKDSKSCSTVYPASSQSASQLCADESAGVVNSLKKTASGVAAIDCAAEMRDQKNAKRNGEVKAARKSPLQTVGRLWRQQGVVKKSLTGTFSHDTGDSFDGRLEIVCVNGLRVSNDDVSLLKNGPQAADDRGPVLLKNAKSENVLAFKIDAHVDDVYL